MFAQKIKNHFLSKFAAALVILGLFASTYAVLAPAPALAQTPNDSNICRSAGANRLMGTQEYEDRCGCKAGAGNNEGNCGIVAYLQLFINVLSALVGVVVVIMVAVGGVQYSSSKDNPQQAAAAKEHIRNAIMALVVYVFSYAFLQWLVPGGIF